MNNVYMKNFAMWLGAPLLALYIIGFITYIPFVHYLILIGGTIMAIIKTHQEIGGRIKFGKAIGPLLLMVGGIAVLGMIISIIRSSIPVMWFLEIMIVELFFELVMAVSILLAAGTWYMYEKAGKPGWAAIVPIYNIIVLCEIANKPTWWVAMLLIPIANIVFIIMIYDGLSKAFGKDSGFTVGLVFLRQIFTAVLGFGDAEYVFDKATPAGRDDIIDN